MGCPCGPSLGVRLCVLDMGPPCGPSLFVVWVSFWGSCVFGLSRCRCPPTCCYGRWCGYPFFYWWVRSLGVPSFITVSLRVLGLLRGSVLSREALKVPCPG